MGGSGEGVSETRELGRGSPWDVGSPWQMGWDGLGRPGMAVPGGRKGARTKKGLS